MDVQKSTGIERTREHWREQREILFPDRLPSLERASMFVPVTPAGFYCLAQHTFGQLCESVCLILTPDDVQKELRLVCAFLDAHPEQRPTAALALDFVGRWIVRAAIRRSKARR